jgi:GT2 family glycosyltransferase
MKPDWSIASVTVTYNAAEVLRKHLDLLLCQSRPINEIIVVDNGSQDSTVEILHTEYPSVAIFELRENLGIGAALAAGLSYAALDKKHDWTWLLDQDSLPESNALDELVRGYSMSAQRFGNTGVVASLPKEEETEISYPGLHWRGRFVAPSAEMCQQPVWFVDATISSGTMIGREVVQNAGLPRADFFMDFVDFEYNLRIRSHGYQIAIVRDSVLHHTIGTPRAVRLFGFTKTWSAHAPWREYYYSRNYTYLVWHIYPQVKSKFFLLLGLVRHGTASLFFGERKFESLYMMLIGFFDGLQGRLGLRFLDDTPRGASTQFAASRCPSVDRRIR